MEHLPPIETQSSWYFLVGEWLLTHGDRHKFDRMYAERHGAKIVCLTYNGFKEVREMSDPEEVAALVLRLLLTGEATTC